MIIASPLAPTPPSSVVPRYPRACSPVTKDDSAVFQYPATVFSTETGTFVVRCAAAPTVAITLANWPAYKDVPFEVVGVNTGSTQTNIFAVY